MTQVSFFRKIVVVACVAALLSPCTAAGQSLSAAQLNCGPHATTYLVKVRVPPDCGCRDLRDGIACSVATGNPGVAGSNGLPVVIWYMEGTDFGGSTSYQRWGIGLPGPSPDELDGQVYYLQRNGGYEATLRAVHGSWPTPAVVDEISSEGLRWSEISALQYTPAPTPQGCAGPFPLRALQTPQYKVTYAGKTGSGFRCLIDTGSTIIGWFGVGTVGRTSYTELGYRTAGGFGQTDICNTNLGSRCLSFAGGSIHIVKHKAKKHKNGTLGPQTMTVKGPGWTETWTAKR